MKSFKFFKSNKASITENPHLYGLTIKNHPDAIFSDREITVVFYWATDDAISYEYELVRFQGRIMGFANHYDSVRESQRQDSYTGNNYLPAIPRIESIVYNDGSEYRKWNHEFQDPNEIVEIFYKLYTT